jgi:hypothetical protein
LAACRAPSRARRGSGSPRRAATALALVTFQSEDHQEALAALREKRLPVFKDR